MSHSAENFRRGNLWCGNIFVCRKSLDNRGGESIKIFRRNFFVSHCRKFKYVGILYCLINFGYRKTLCFGGLCHDFLTTFWPTVPKKLVGETFCAVFQKNSGSEKFIDKRGGGGEFQDFLSKFFCLTVPKISVGGAIL